MPIVITVEDGSNVANSNSFNTVVEARAYAAARGIVLSAVDDEVAAQLIKATDYIESKQAQFQGVPSYADQSLCFPRYGVELNGDEFASNAIPKQLKSAQLALVLAVHAGIDLLPNVTPGDYVVKEKVGPIETEYANPLSVGIQPSLSGVEALLAPLYKQAGGFSLRTMRV